MNEMQTASLYSISAKSSVDERGFPDCLLLADSIRVDHPTQKPELHHLPARGGFTARCANAFILAYQ
jgi:hypothetical protein